MTKIRKFIWDITYACPLRCLHCYSESGRRAPRTLDRTRAMQVIDVMLEAEAEVVSISGGEPLSIKWSVDAMERLHSAGIDVTVFTSGYVMNENLATRLASSCSTVAISIDGPTGPLHDRIRGRIGGFETALNALDTLHRISIARSEAGLSVYRLGIDFTLTRSALADDALVEFAQAIGVRYPKLSFIRFGAVIPSGLAAEQPFEQTEMLTMAELEGLQSLRERIARQLPASTEVSVTDVRYFLPTADMSAADLDILQIEPDGALRAFPIYEAKVGNVLEEPLDILWERALAWRCDPWVTEQMTDISDMADWAAATRALDRRYGAEDDRARIAKRAKEVLPS